MNNTPINNENEEIFDLKLKISVAVSKLDEIQNQLHEFESLIRSFVLDDMILEQELAAKYRNFQRAKKDKRKEQKRKGKNYQAPKGLVKELKQCESELMLEDTLRLKKMYRDTMMLIHPDRVEEVDKKKATENTSKLVELYQSKNIQEMELFCNHLLFNNDSKDIEITSIDNPTLAYFTNELDKVQWQINQLKSKHTYQVLNTYERPIDFVQELKDYYKDRIEKLKRRTRKVK